MGFNIAMRQDKVRRICCSLSTFVKIVCIFFLVLYLCIGLSGVFWFLSEQLGFSFFQSHESSTIVSVAEKEDGEINGFEEFTIENNINKNDDNDGSFRKIVIFSIVLIFTLTGVMVNLLVILSMRANKRTLIIPWLVYHTGVIIGCFASGVYLVVYFTIIKPQDAIDPSENRTDKKYAVLGLLPIVGGIFFIFIWILIDQQFIQMGKIKNGNDRHKTIVIHSAPSIASIDMKLRDSSSVISQNKFPILEHQLYYSESVKGSESGRISVLKRRAVTPNPSGRKNALRSKTLKNGTQSLPRSALRNNNTSKQKTLFKTLMQQKHTGSKRSLNNSNCSSDKFVQLSTPCRRTQVHRSKSLEQILDSNSNSSRSSNGKQFNNVSNLKSRRNHSNKMNQNPNYWIAENTGLSRNNVVKHATKTHQNSASRISNIPLYSIPMKKSVSMHDIIDEEIPRVGNGHMNNSQANIPNQMRREPIFNGVTSRYDQYPGNQFDRRTEDDFFETIYSPNNNPNAFISSYCTVDNRRAKNNGGLAKRQQQRDILHISTQQNGNVSSNSSENDGQGTVRRNMRPSVPSSILTNPNKAGSKMLLSPSKPPRKTLPLQSVSNNFIQPSPSRPMKNSNTQFYNAYEPSSNIHNTKTMKLLSGEQTHGHMISKSEDKIGNMYTKGQNDNTEIRYTNDNYIDEVNKEIEDNLRFIKEAVSKNNIATEHGKGNINESQSMKTFGTNQKEPVLESDNFPPPPSCFLNGQSESANECAKMNDEYMCPPTPPPPPPPPDPSLQRIFYHVKNENDINTPNFNNNTDQNRSSYTDSPSERSEPSELDLSMLPLDAKSWSQRLERKDVSKVNNIPNSSSSIPYGPLANKTKKTRHNYENHDIKAVRIAPKVTHIQYSGGAQDDNMVESRGILYPTQMDHQIPSKYETEVIKIDDIEDLPSDQILHQTLTLNNEGSHLVNGIKPENSTTSPTNRGDIWLPQPIYPNSELPPKAIQPSPSIIKLDNSAKKKNVQNWLQKITQPSKTTTIQKHGNVHNKVQTSSILKQPFPVDYYGGNYGGDVRL